jgi:hypothetical protein
VEQDDGWPAGVAGLFVGHLENTRGDMLLHGVPMVSERERRLR